MLLSRLALVRGASVCSALGVMAFSLGAALGAGCATAACNDSCTLIDILVTANGEYTTYSHRCARRGCNNIAGTQNNPANPQPATVTTWNNGMTASNCPQDAYPMPGTGGMGNVVFVDNNANVNVQCGLNNS